MKQFDPTTLEIYRALFTSVAEEMGVALRRTAFHDTTAYFHRFADLTDEQAHETALGIWAAVNGPNLRDNIAPTRSRARLVLQKAADHSVRRVLLRKV